MAEFEAVDYDPFAPKPKSGATKSASDRVAARRSDKGVLRKIDAGIRGAADFLSLGTADEASAAVNSIPGLLNGGVQGYQDAYKANLLAEQAIDQADREQVPASRMAGQVAGFAGSLGAGALATGAVRGAAAGRPIAQGLLSGGGALGNVGRGIVAGSTLGAVQGAASAQPGAENRIEGAQRGGLLGGVLGGAAVPVAGLLGRGATALTNAAARGSGVTGRIGRAVQRSAGLMDDTSSRAMRYVGGNADEMAARAAEYRSAGLEPTITDIGGNAVRRRIRASGVRSQEAGEALANRADVLGATAKPSVIARTRRLSTPEVGPGDMRTAEQAAGQVVAQRGRQATAQYADDYARTFDIPDDTLTAVRSPAGRAAVNDAMDLLRQRPETRATRQTMSELEALVGNGPVPPISGATLDEIQIFMRQAADNLASSPMSRNTRMAGAIRDTRRVINNTLDEAPGLGPARENFADYSGQSEILREVDVPDFLTTDPRDYARYVAGLTDGQRVALAKRVEQDLGETLGGQRAATLGSMDTITSSDFARRNLQSALGAERAASYLAGVEGTMRQVQNARFVSPNDGSRTTVLSADTQDMAEGVLNTGVNTFSAAKGNPIPLIRQTVDFLTSRQISRQTAEEVANIVTDPARTDEAIALLSRELPRLQAVGVVRQLQQLGTRSGAEGMAGGQPRVVRRFTGPGNRPYVELEWPDNPGVTIEAPATDSIR